MARILTRLKVNEVSGVDRGAGEGVKVLIMKQDQTGGAAVLPLDQLYDFSKSHAELIAGALLPVGLVTSGARLEAADGYLKREISADKRKELAAAGKAMPGGGFPIENVSDLENAVQAFGRAKDKDATRKHIIARARALKATDKLPESWSVGKLAKVGAWFKSIVVGKAMTFEEAQAGQEVQEYASGMLDELCEANDALRQSVFSILGDDSVTDKSAAIHSTFQQYKDHIGTMVPEELEKAMRDAALATAGAATHQGDPSTSKRGPDMATQDDVTKAAMEAVHKAIGGFSAEHQEYAKSLDDPAKALFSKLAPEARDEFLKAFPPKKGGDDKGDGKGAGAKNDDDEDDMKKALAALPESLRKRIEGYSAMEKQVAALTQQAALATFQKRADDMALGAGGGEVLMKAYQGDAAAIDKLVGHVAALRKQADTGVVFAEFGKVGDGSVNDNAYNQLCAKAQALADASQGKLTFSQAFEKVYTDPANRDMAKRERSENRPVAA